MTPPIERVRYYDGEYLRAFDFAAEQAYHVDMRRRLNIGLHLYGVVEGLQLQDTSGAGISQVSVASGMAIDAFGREIFLLAPYTFDDVADVNANRITVGGQYEVWVQYVRIQDTPPSVGYAVCDVTAQYTRWLETYKIVLLKSTTPTSLTPPQVTDDISEDETPDPDTSNGVFLGIINVNPASTSGVFSYLSPKPGSITFVGLRAQQIQPPNFANATPPVITNANDPHTAPLAVEVQSNLFCDQNLIVGPDFPVPLAANPGPPPFPSPTGNVKVAADLFLQGNLYTQQSAVWSPLGVYIKSLLPDIQISQLTVPLSGTGHLDPITVVNTLSPKSAYLPQIDPTRLSVFASISAMELDGLGTTYTLAELSPKLYIQVTTSKPVYVAPNGCTLTLTVTVDPSINPGGLATNNVTPWSSVTVAYIVTFYPL